jgi:hypothetical protein
MGNPDDHAQNPMANLMAMPTTRTFQRGTPGKTAPAGQKEAADEDFSKGRLQEKPRQLARKKQPTRIFLRGDSR